MASTINTNIASLTAQRNLASSQASLNTSMQRLSSGLRINSAKDDAAGLAISDRMTSQIRGLNQAARNANDGISLSQVAEGAMGSMSANLQRIRELAVQSANATNSTSDREALQQEVTQLKQEILRVATQTEFNGLKLLDGTYSGQQFQVGANANQTINVSVSSAMPADMGVNSASSALTGSISTATLGALNKVTADLGTITISGNGVTSDPFTIALNATGKTIATSINAVSAATGVVATAKTTATISGVSAGTVSFTLTGTGSKPITATVTSPNDLSAVAAAINKETATTNITATSDLLGNLVLTDADGNDIKVVTTQTAALSIGMGTAKIRGTETPAVIALDAGALDGGGAPVVGAGTATVGAKLTLDSKSQFTVLGAIETTVFASGSVASGINSVATLDISTVANANDALKVVDAALSLVSSNRATLGAVQNRFLTTIENLNTTSENLSASRSRIQDADFAMETANLSRTQILQQAGTAMVAQANQLPQGVLALLRQ
jgi:flagellin